ncbi:hypothetical protein [Mycobacterium uberis]|nr:hypothetical protein [Mycobacterium uberis]
MTKVANGDRLSGGAFARRLINISRSALKGWEGFMFWLVGPFGE